MNILNKIDAHLLTEKKRERSSHYSSEMLNCKRQLYYKWTKTPETNPTDAGGYYKMRMGVYIERMVQDMIEDAGFKVERNVRGRGEIDGLEYPIGYEIDMIVTEDGGETFGVECKTSYGAGVKRIQEDGMPKREHLAQVICYIVLHNLDRFVLLYLGRDNAYRTQFLVERIDGQFYLNHKPIEVDFDKFTNRLKELEVCVAESHLPDRDYKVAIKNGEIKKMYQKDNVKYKSDWQCMYCGWQTECWKDEINS